ncbi:MAG: glutathione S-transferase family protein [Pseudomonadota bacterium]
MIKLLTYPPMFDDPAASPFCVKAIWLLNLSGQKWERQDVLDPRKMPFAKLPVIDVAGTLIPDSDNIRAYLEQQGAEFDSGLSELDRATSRAFIRMAEEHMYFHLVLDRWANDAVWPMIREAYFASIPTPLRAFVASGMRRNLIKGLKAQGLARLSASGRLARLEPDLAAITARLWQGAFLFGDHPTAADASVAAMLAAMQSTPTATAQTRRIAEDQVLSRYIDRAKDAMGTKISAASERLCA